ncbi:helix-turn-helix domain-containing protein [Paenibacillus protaetiae]|uniref:AraC family transcriptional regulator n=1 Tax=Paenibacillus protaetiae TaxID=2509456 RepID=A0A4V0YFK4_9BACL|nr:AraC family transcriptional regulator [Paenibacillus protaetiae]QAY68021.1 AraC family transcriptional regulator [Paenibacillus protaetiae]
MQEHWGNAADGYRGIQFGFEWNTLLYIEKKVLYGEEPVLYYQFRTRKDGDGLRVVPDGCVDLLFCCDPARPFAMVCGSVLAGQRITFLNDTDYFGVRLTPALSMQIPGLPLKELVEVQAPIEQVWASYAHASEQIAACRGLNERIRYFERLGRNMLSAQEDMTGLVTYCLHAVHASKGLVPVQELSAYTGYSERYVRTKFENALGMPPKMYNRIIRFQHALRSMMADGVLLMDVADSHGYYDQAHFAKEFKTFTGMTPRQLQQERAGGVGR